MNNAKNTYNSVDLFKFIAALLVITLHCSPLQSFDENINLFYVSTIPRLAVPFFFACSSYFFFSGLTYKNNKLINCKENRGKLYKYIKRLCLLYIMWSIIYLFYQIPEWYSIGWLSVNAFIDYALSFFLIGSYYHLWYILSLIYATIIGYVLLSNVKSKAVVMLSAVLYIVGLLTFSYNWIDVSAIQMLNSVTEPLKILWDSLTRALPLMMFGFYAGNNRFRFSLKLNVLLFFASLVGLCLELFVLFKHTTNNGNYSYLFFTPICEILLINLVLKLKIDGNKKYFLLARNLSTILYCLHPLIRNLLYLLPNFENVNSIIRYSLVVLISLGVSVVLIEASKKFKKLRYLW